MERGFGGEYDGWGKKQVMPPVRAAERKGCYGILPGLSCVARSCQQVSPGVSKVFLVNMHSELCMLVNALSGVIDISRLRPIT